MISLFIDKSTISKIQIYNDQGNKELKSLFPPHHFPSFWGGRCDDDLWSNPGPWHDEINVNKGLNLE